MWWRHGSGIVRQQQRRVDVAVVVGREDRRARRGRAAGRGRGRSGAASGLHRRRAPRPASTSTAGHAGRVAPGPVGVVVGAERALGLGRLDPAGHGGAAAGTAAAAGRRRGVARRPW